MEYKQYHVYVCDQWEYIIYVTDITPDLIHVIGDDFNAFSFEIEDVDPDEEDITYSPRGLKYKKHGI